MYDRIKILRLCDSPTINTHSNYLYLFSISTNIYISMELKLSQMQGQYNKKQTIMNYLKSTLIIPNKIIPRYFPGKFIHKQTIIFQNLEQRRYELYFAQTSQTSLILHFGTIILLLRACLDFLMIFCSLKYSLKGQPAKITKGALCLSRNQLKLGKIYIKKQYETQRFKSLIILLLIIIFPTKMLSKLATSTIKFPQHIKELDAVGHQVWSYQIDQADPSQKDIKYIQRRRIVSEMAKKHKMGAQIYQVSYSKEEQDLWKRLFQKSWPYRKELLAERYLKNIKELMRETAFHQQIPKMNILSNYLHSKSGFRLKPVAGIISPRQFLNCLAFKVFCCSQFFRHPLCEEFSPEPDIFHQYLGHIPAFADLATAKASQEIGLLSLGASDEEIQILGKAYLHFFEFGLCKQSGREKVYGAGIGSCLSDLKKILAGNYKTSPFDPMNQWRKPFDYSGQQNSFWLAQSFDEAVKKIVDLHLHISKGFRCEYNNQENKIEIIQN